ncbi:MAG: hypothetical protein IH946_12500, partial [Bacteroidetes bacterium]|nr:hypothetical protein [Bacteroidota bacterium]
MSNTDNLQSVYDDRLSGLTAKDKIILNNHIKNESDSEMQLVSQGDNGTFVLISSDKKVAMELSFSNDGHPYLKTKKSISFEGEFKGEVGGFKVNDQGKLTIEGTSEKHLGGNGPDSVDGVGYEGSIASIEESTMIVYDDGISVVINEAVDVGKIDLTVGRSSSGNLGANLEAKLAEYKIQGTIYHTKVGLDQYDQPYVSQVRFGGDMGIGVGGGVSIDKSGASVGVKAGFGGGVHVGYNDLTPEVNDLDKTDWHTLRKEGAQNEHYIEDNKSGYIKGEPQRSDQDRLDHLDQVINESNKHIAAAGVDTIRQNLEDLGMEISSGSISEEGIPLRPESDQEEREIYITPDGSDPSSETKGDVSEETLPDQAETEPTNEDQEEDTPTQILEPEGSNEDIEEEVKSGEEDTQTDQP